MNIKKKKLLTIILFMCYILSNLMFYNTFYKDYVNRDIFFTTSLLFIFEIIFWIVIFSFIEISKNIKISDKIMVKGIFLTAIAGTGLGRILLNSSPYINDLLNASMFLVYLFGIGRVLLIFSVILFVFYIREIKGIKGAILNVIAVLNIAVSILIWLDFDTAISSVLRMVIGFLGIVCIILLKEQEINKEERNEETSD